MVSGYYDSIRVFVWQGLIQVSISFPHARRRASNGSRVPIGSLGANVFSSPWSIFEVVSVEWLNRLPQQVNEQVVSVPPPRVWTSVTLAGKQTSMERIPPDDCNIVSYLQCHPMTAVFNRTVHWEAWLRNDGDGDAVHAEVKLIDYSFFVVHVLSVKWWEQWVYRLTRI